MSNNLHISFIIGSEPLDKHFVQNADTFKSALVVGKMSFSNCQTVEDIKKSINNALTELHIDNSENTELFDYLYNMMHEVDEGKEND